MIAAALGGDREAIQTGLEIDANIAAAVATAAITSAERQQQRAAVAFPLGQPAQGLTPATIEYVIDLYRPQFDACVRPGDDEVNEEVFASFYLPPHGHPQNIRVRGSRFVAGCIAGIIAQIVFPVAETGSNVQFEHVLTVTE